MPRINVYISDHLDMELRTYPGKLNLSRICAAAIAAELAARLKRPIPWLSGFDKETDSKYSKVACERYGLRRCISAPSGDAADAEPRTLVSVLTKNVLDRTMREGLELAIGGGTQMYDVVRLLERRNVGMSVWAIGAGDVDAETPHEHPNALVTLLSLLYTPRTTAHLVGAPHFDKRWCYPAVYPFLGKEIKRIIVGGCGIFHADSAYARLLGTDVTDFLAEENALGDFLGVFVNAKGTLIEPYPPSMKMSHIGSADLAGLARREDTMVIMAAAGKEKRRLMRAVLDARLCNVLISDDATVRALL